MAPTKTYTTQLLAIAMLLVPLRGESHCLGPLKCMSIMAQQAPALDVIIKLMTERRRYMGQCVVLGRGYDHATAFEWSIELREAPHIVGCPYSSAGLRHGPVAMGV